MSEEVQPFSHNGIDHSYDGTPKAITKIVMDGGIITELETTDISAAEGMDFAHDGDKMEITKLTIVNGLITELEFGV